MSVLVIGLNHTTAPLDLRGRFAFVPGELAPALKAVRDRISLAPDVALLSTCNRTELYVGGDPSHTQQWLEHGAQWLAEVGGVSRETLMQHSYVRQGADAARHAFRVASGLDSMVLGEPQILGQMKLAVREADMTGTLGTTLSQLFQRAFSVAKEVRTATDIGAHSISMAAATVRVAAQLFEDLRDVRVLFVGAGEMIDLVATHFAAKKPRSITVANRTLERAQALAARLGAEATRLSELPQRLAQFDVVVSCTASSLPIIGLGAVERALKLRRHRPMFMVDLAVPRDIEPEVARLPDAYLYTVDDLSTLVQTAGEKRQAAVREAEVIVDGGVDNFVQWLSQRDTVPLIRALQRQADAWRSTEITRARRLIARGEDVDTVLETLSRAVAQKLLHGTLAELRNADAADRAQLADTVTRLFLRGQGGASASSSTDDTPIKPTTTDER